MIQSKALHDFLSKYFFLSVFERETIYEVIYYLFYCNFCFTKS